MLTIVETARDAMQGIKKFIPTELKIAYVQSLLDVGFQIVDVGSFVAPRAVPQMSDTAEVIKKLDLTGTDAELMVLVSNPKGAKIAVEFDEIAYITYPYSISKTFLRKNLNTTDEKALSHILEVQEICNRRNKKMIVYMSMAFGNPYGDEWNLEILEASVAKLKQQGFDMIPLSDTVGQTNDRIIRDTFDTMIEVFPDMTFGLHLHAKPNGWFDRVDAAYKAGCRHFETVINGLGGCPMADDELVGNLSTQSLLMYCERNKIPHPISKKALDNAAQKAAELNAYA